MSLSLRISVATALACALGCKAGEGDRCLCGDDCRDGLACVVGNAKLDEDLCAPEGQNKAGTCVDEDKVPEGSGSGPDPGVGRTDMSMSRRDFEPPVPPASTSSTGATSTGTSSATSGTTSSTGGSTGTSNGGGSTSTSTTSDSTGVGSTSASSTAGSTGAP